MIYCLFDGRIRRGILLFILFLMLIYIPLSDVHCSSEYVYYGVVDCRAKEALIALVGLEDDTIVRIYDLGRDKLISEVRLDRLEKRFVVISNGTMFKLVSDHLVSVTLLAGRELPDPKSDKGPVVIGFLTSTSGNYVGKEFIFVASQELSGTPYRILALEDSKITIFKEDGGEYMSFSLKANEYRDISLKSWVAYRVKSTGNIIIQSGEIWRLRSLFIPSVDGSFIGRHFYSRSLCSWPAHFDYGFKILSLKNAKVTIWDVKFKRVIERLKVEGGRAATVKPKAEEIFVESDEPIVLSFVHNKSVRALIEYRASSSYMSVKPGVEALIYIPMKGKSKAYIFAYEDTVVEIDDAPLTLRKDSYFMIKPGIHKIKASKDIVIQLVHWVLLPPEWLAYSLEEFGTPIPCVQTVNTTPKVKLKPLTGEAMQISYTTIGAIIAIIVIATLCLIAVKRRGKT